jgi:hypothetical protein
MIFNIYPHVKNILLKRVSENEYALPRDQITEDRKDIKTPHGKKSCCKEKG